MRGFYWKRALWNFSAALLLAISLFVLVAASIHYGLTDLLGLTAMAKDALFCCKTVFSWCLVSPNMFKAIIPWVGFGIVTAGLATASFRSCRSLMVSRRFLRNIYPAPQKSFPALNTLAGDGDIKIIPFEDSVLKSAFTIGLLRPRVYVSTGLIHELTDGELRAVILHEVHHAVNKDPLRLFILTFIRNTFFFLPMGHYLNDSFYVHKELAADEGAASKTGRPFDLATALLKMVRIKRKPLPAGVPILEKGEFIERRVKSLLEPDTKRDRFPKGSVLFTVAAMMILFMTLVLPINAGTPAMEKCNHNYCLSEKSVCPNNMKDCERSCEKMRKK